MVDEKELYPKEPEKAIITALKSIPLWAVVGAAFGAVVKKIPVIRVFHPGNVKEEIISSAVWTGLAGGTVGFIEGARKNAQYPLQVENTKLQIDNIKQREEIADLKSGKSFTQSIQHEKLTGSDQISRS